VEGAKLLRRYVAEKTSPRALELKKSPSSLRKYELCKALILMMAEILEKKNHYYRRCLHTKGHLGKP